MLFSAYMWVHFCSVVGGLSKQSIYGIIDLYRVLALGLFRLVKHKLKLKPGRKTLNRGARGEGPGGARRGRRGRREGGLQPHTTVLKHETQGRSNGDSGDTHIRFRDQITFL